MRVGLQSWGTEGDLRPFLALGQALQRRGHDVKVVFTSIEGKDFTSLAASTGVETRFVDDGYFVANREELGRRTRDGLKANPTKQLELVLKYLMDPVTGPQQRSTRSRTCSSRSSPSSLRRTTHERFTRALRPSAEEAVQGRRAR